MNKIDEELEFLMDSCIKCIETCDKLREEFNKFADENGRVTVAFKYVAKLLNCSEHEAKGIAAILSDKREGK